jgi:tetratricopeptide (TPR) repeat protein
VALLGVVLILAASAVLVVLRRTDPDSTAVIPLPPPTRSFTDSAMISAADFVGSETCASCHGAEFASWTGSTHAAAGGAPGRVRVIAPFDGSAIRFRDGEVIASSSGGTHRFIVRQRGKPERVLRVDGVVGGGHMNGGGTQGFVSRQADGTMRFLPFDFIRREGVWFCNTNSRANRGWVAITPELSLADCGDWPPVRALGDELRFANCQSCHGSQIATSLDSTGNGYRTSIASLGINCESCHGPGRPHIEAVRDPRRMASGDLAMAALATQSRDASLGTCWQCHALKDQLRPGYLPGKRFDAYYSTHLAQLGDAAHLPDGRVRTFAYQQGHLYSQCYVNGGMTCTSCHDPHSQRYRSVEGEPLPGRFDDRQCTSCHASKAELPELHTHHPIASEGSRCTGCHMPYLQEPEVGTALRYARSDHSIPIPRPGADSAIGVVSSCRTCHADRSESALDAIVQQWYGELKPRSPTVAAVLSWKAGDDIATASRALLDTATAHTAGLVAGLGRFIEHYVRMDAPLPDRDAMRRLESLAAHRDVDVRAMALASLHALAGSRVATRRVLVRGLSSPDEAVLRSRWAVVLGFIGDRARGAGDPASAAGAYRRAIEVEPANARLHLNLGLALADAGQIPDAVASYHESLRLDARQPLALVNLGIALAAQADAAGAADAYGRALRLNRNEPLAHFNLGNLQLESGDLDAARLSYERAIAADPSIALAHFYLARVLAQRGNVRGALDAIEDGLEFDPRNPEAIAARAQLLRMAGAVR